MYNDKSKNIVSLQGRQTYKSTGATDLVGCYATSHDNVELTYVVDRADRASAWSKQRFRKDTLIKNPLLAQFLPQGRAAVGDINLLNNTVVYVRTDEGEYNNVQGMTNWLMVFDECQYQELQFRTAALYSMSQTKGQVYYFGVGGELGSEWYKLWKESDQKEWIFDDENWRDKLEFDEDGNLSNKNPHEIMKGRWVAQAPENTAYSGYHMPQTIFARIPLTIKDAIEKYKTRPENSIEYKEDHDPSSMVTSHVFGEFYKAMRRPITPDMVESCYDKTLPLLTGQQVIDIKQRNRDNVQIFLGIDWGSGPSASQTVGAVVIYWIKQNRFQLAWIDPRPQEDERSQAAYFVNLFKEYGCDYCVADMGYGKEKVTAMQKGGFDIDGTAFDGLGNGMVMGCWSSGNLTEETHTQKEKTEIDSPKVGKKLPYFSVDKTEIIQSFIDLLGSTVPLDGHPVSKFIIPYADDSIKYLLDDFCHTTRKDLSDDEETVKDDPRQKAKKEFNHPKDTMMSIIYCMIAKDKFDPHRFEIFAVKK